MPLQALLAAFLAFVAAAVTIVVPWDPTVAFEARAPVTLVQWGLFWLVLAGLAGLAIGLGRQLEDPFTRLLPFVPTALLLLVALSGRPSPALELGRMHIPVPPLVKAAGNVALSGAVWSVALLFAPAFHRWLASQRVR